MWDEAEDLEEPRTKCNQFPSHPLFSICLLYTVPQDPLFIFPDNSSYSLSDILSIWMFQPVKYQENMVLI